MPNRKAIITAVIIFLAIFAVRQTIQFRGFLGAGDLAGVLALARNLRDPYAATTDVPYTLPAGLIVWPLAWLPDRLAGSAFAATSAAALAYGVVRRTGQPWRLMMFFSLPFAHALEWAQWSIAISAAWYIPQLAWVCVLAKPQTAWPVAINRVTRAGLAYAGVILVMAFAIRPGWPIEWAARTADYHFVIPLLAPGGILIVLAAQHIANERARLLMFLSITPTRGAYDTLALFIIPETPQQMTALVAASWVTPFYIWYIVALGCALGIQSHRRLSCRTLSV